MKKKLTTAALLLASVIAANGCDSDEVTYKTTKDGESIIFSIKNGDETEYYTANDLLKDLQTSSDAKSTLYDEVSRQVFTEYAKKKLSTYTLNSLDEDADSKVDDFKDDCKSSASDEGVDYDTYLEEQLEAKGVETLSGLHDLYYYELLKDELVDDYFEDETNYQYFLQKYLDTYTPFQVKHILVAANSSDANMKDGTMTADNARKLLTIIDRFLAGENFESIAELTDDTSSAVNGGIMPFNEAQDYVSEFRFATYAQEIFANNTTAESRYNVAADLHVIDKEETTQEEFENSNLYDIYGNGISAVKLSEIMKLNEKVTENMAGAYNYYDYTGDNANKVSGKPAKDVDIPTVAEQTYEMNVSEYADDGEPNKKYYEEYELERNQIFNKTLNSHKVQYIELDGYETKNSTTIKVYDETEGKLVEKKVLADGENGNPIFFALASTGIHFMSMVWDSYNPTSIVLSDEQLNSLSKFIVDRNDLTVTDDDYYKAASALDDFDDQLNYAYFTLYDSSITDMEEYKYTYIGQNAGSIKATISSNSDSLEDDISSYASNLEYYLFNEIVYSETSTIIDDSNHFKVSFYDDDLYDLVKEYVTDQITSTDDSFTESVIEAAESYGTKLAREKEVKASLDKWTFAYDFED